MRWTPSHPTVVAYLALGVALSGTAVAATGGTFLLGRGNSAGRTTALSNTGSGPALKLGSRSGTPALSVGNTAKVARLNADLLDGTDSSALQHRVVASCPSIRGIRAIAAGGKVSCSEHPYRIVTSSTLVSVPAGVTHALVQVRGAGGGGGSAANGGNGSGGGQGGAELVVITVKPGAALSVVIGTGGTGGTPIVNSGTGGRGGMTQLIRQSSGAVLAEATGGFGGLAGPTFPNVQAGGAGGSGAAQVVSGAIGLQVQGGVQGGGSGYLGDSAHPNGGKGGGPGMAGAGGNGGLGTTSSDGAPGHPGFVLIQWL